MPSKWHEKQEKKRVEQALRDEAAVRDAIDFEGDFAKDTRGAAMGEGEDELFEKKLSKEEKKALAKAKREAKKKAKGKGSGDKGGNSEEKKGADLAKEVLKNAQDGLFAEKDLSVTNEAADKLASEGTICTFSTSKKGVDERSRDINVSNFTLQHKGMVMLDGTDIILNHGNRYGLIGRNGCGKVRIISAEPSQVHLLLRYCQ